MHFFACLSRMKLIRRWGLMRNTRPENDMEHSLEAAIIAHGLAVIARERFGRDVNAERVVTLAVYHDASEALTGDLPTPIKYAGPEIERAYHALEDAAQARLSEMLPEDMRGAYRPYLFPDKDSYEWKLVKAADRISAYVKCLEEQEAGNSEFEQARESVLEQLLRSPMPEVAVFMKEFVPSYALSLDQLSGGWKAR